MQHGTVAIPKSARPERMAENFEVFDLEPSTEEIAAIDALDRGADGRVGPDPDTTATALGNVAYSAAVRDLPMAAMEDNRAVIGELNWLPASRRLDLVAEPVRAALSPEAEVVEIDPDLADTAAFCERYGVPLAVSANCVIIAARRGGTVSHAACVVLAIDRVDVNGRVRRHLGARKASFAPMEEATALTGMEYGGITPVGLPGWPVLVDEAVVRQPYVVLGSGLRRSKLLVPGNALAELPSAEIVGCASRATRRDGPSNAIAGMARRRNARAEAKARSADLLARRLPLSALAP